MRQLVSFDLVNCDQSDVANHRADVEALKCDGAHARGNLPAPTLPKLARSEGRKSGSGIGT
jgi:hypothetical protein